ncbi:hypothetical protein ACKWTF_003175 [Chironomus riparius]
MTMASTKQNFLIEKIGRMKIKWWDLSESIKRNFFNSFVSSGRGNKNNNKMSAKSLQTFPAIYCFKIEFVSKTIEKLLINNLLKMILLIHAAQFTSHYFQGFIL